MYIRHSWGAKVAGFGLEPRCEHVCEQKTSRGATRPRRGRQRALKTRYGRDPTVIHALINVASNILVRAIICRSEDFSY